MNEKIAADEDPDVVVGVASYNRSSSLPRLVAGLETQSYPQDRFEVIIVDNASTDDTGTVLAELAASTPLRLRPLTLSVNRGPAGARNAVWRSTSAELIAFTDDDCVPDPTWLAAGVEALRRNPRAGVAQGRSEHPHGSEDFPWGDWTVSRRITQPTPWFEAYNLFFRREALEEAGGFDEDFGYFAEETALCWQVLENGWERVFAKDAVVRHDLVNEPVAWHMRRRFLENRLVDIAARHPAMREAFWRPWAVKRDDVLFVVGVAGLLGALRRPALGLLTLPWIRARRPHRGHPQPARLLAERAAVDAAGVAGMLLGSLRNRRFLL